MRVCVQREREERKREGERERRREGERERGESDKSGQQIDSCLINIYH